MITEVAIYSNPVALPGVCCKCGSQDKDWFVDLGFDYEMKTCLPDNPYPVSIDGVMYLCCDCINSLYLDINRKLDQFEENKVLLVPFVGRLTEEEKEEIDGYYGELWAHYKSPADCSGTESDDSRTSESNSELESKLSALPFLASST